MRPEKIAPTVGACRQGCKTLENCITLDIHGEGN